MKKSNPTISDLQSDIITRNNPKKIMKNLNLIVILFSLLMTVSCGKDTTNPSTPTGPALAVTLKHLGYKDILVAKVSGGQEPYQYHWDQSTNNDSLPNTVTAPIPGDYTVIVTDANGTQITETIRVHGYKVTHTSIQINSVYITNFDIRDVSVSKYHFTIGENGYFDYDKHRISLFNGIPNEYYYFSWALDISGYDLKDRKWKVQLEENGNGGTTTYTDVLGGTSIEDRGSIKIMEYDESEENGQVIKLHISFNHVMLNNYWEDLRILNGDIYVDYF